MGVDEVVVRPVALTVRDPIKVEITNRNDRAALLAVEDVAIDIEGVGERIEPEVCWSARNVGDTTAGSTMRMLSSVPVCVARTARSGVLLALYSDTFALFSA